MKKHQIILSPVLLVFALGVLSPEFAQDTGANPSKPDQEKRANMVSLLRTINTDEVTYRSKHGSYGMWQNLLSDEPQYFEKFLSINGFLQKNIRFGDAPEVLPGVNLRLNVHTDGQGYDVLLEDKTANEGFAFLSDERGVIRVCTWLQ